MDIHMTQNRSLVVKGRLIGLSMELMLPFHALQNAAQKEIFCFAVGPFRHSPFCLASRSFSRRIFVYPACDLAEAAAGKSVNIAASSLAPDALYRVSDDVETLSAIPAIWICTNTLVSLDSKIRSGGDSY